MEITVLDKNELKAILHTRGFTIIDEFIKERMEDCSNRLLNGSIDEILNIRAKYEAYKSINAHIEYVLDYEED